MKFDKSSWLKPFPVHAGSVIRSTAGFHFVAAFFFPSAYRSIRIFFKFHTSYRVIGRPFTSTREVPTMAQWDPGRYRELLQVMARRLQLDPRLKRRFDSSDLVHETLT